MKKTLLTEGVLAQIAVGQIVASKTNARKEFSGAKWEELVASVRASGVQIPIGVRALAKVELREPDMVTKTWALVRDMVIVEEWPKECEKMARGRFEEESAKGYELIYGERRWRVAQQLKLATIPALVRVLTDDQALEVQALENLDRADLNPLEEAQNYETLVKAGWTVEEIGRKFGKSRSVVFQMRALLKTAPAVRAAMEKGEIPASIGSLAGALPTVKLQEAFLAEVLERAHNEWIRGEDGPDDSENRHAVCVSVRKAQAMLREQFCTDLTEAEFDLKRSYGVEGLIYTGDPAPAPRVACVDCPHRSGNARDEFPGIQSPDVCTRPNCFALKTELAFQEAVAPLVAQGCVALTAKEARKELDYDGKKLRYDTALLETAAKIPVGKKEMTVAEALGKNAPTPVAAVVNGKAVKLYRKKEVQQALVAAGLMQAGEERGQQEGYKELQKKRQERKEINAPVAARALALLFTAIEKSKPTALEFLRNCVQENQWPAYSLSDLDQKIAKTDKEATLVARIMECQFDDGLDYTGEFDAEFLATCKEYGIDVKAMAKEAAAKGNRAVKPAGKELPRKVAKDAKGKGKK